MAGSTKPSNPEVPPTQVTNEDSETTNKDEVVPESSKGEASPELTGSGPEISGQSETGAQNGLEPMPAPQAKPNIPSIAGEGRRSQRIQGKRNRMGRQTLDPEVVGTGEDKTDPDYQ